MSSQLLSFLQSRYSVKNAEGHAIFTHTSLGDPKGAYFIKEEDQETLFGLIINSVFQHKKPVFLSEKPLAVKMITIDIDEKYPIDCSTRQHKEAHILELLKLYQEAICLYVDLPEHTPIDAYVFQRSGPYMERGNMKDGIHIMYPHLYMHTDVQHLIRTYVLKHIDRFINNPEIGVLPVKNTPDDILDRSVIDKNNWLMYGCSKPGKLPYQLHGIYNKAFEPVPKSDDHLALIKLLSIHRKSDVDYQVKPEFAHLIDEMAKPKTRVVKPKSTTPFVKPLKSTLEDEGKKNLSEDAKKLVKLLGRWRADDYHTWIEVGWCLYNINTGLKDTWVEFSKLSDKYTEGACEIWHTFEKGNLNIGSLHRWAKNDDPDPKKQGYNQTRSDMLQSVILQSLGGASQDVARVVYEMYKHQYVCVDAKGKKWAEFSNHSWKITEEGISLKKKLGKEVLDEYLSLISDYHTKTKSTDDEDLRENYQQRAKALNDISYKLRDISFKEKIMKEAILLFHDATFEESLDMNPYLLGMTNGIYDLKQGVFRDGRPEDRVSLSTNIDFPEFENDSIDVLNELSDIPEVEAIFSFMKQVMPQPERRRYFWLSLASYMKGLNSEEKFHLWDGHGGNGKSKILELFEASLGEYCFKLPISLLTQKRGQSGGATPELTLAGVKRFGSFQEPDEGARINVGLLKELSGNDKLYTRKLYGEATVVSPMFSLVLLCNHIPKAPADDEGTWRRLVRMVFESTFVDQDAHRKLGPNEFYKNIYLSQEFPRWAPYFFAILTLFFKSYIKDGLKIPAIVKADTDVYRKDCDAYAMFVEDYIETQESGVLYLDDTYAAFKDWYAGEYNEKAPTRRDFKSYMDKKLGRKYNGDNKAGWKGFNLKLMSLESSASIPNISSCL
jgi:phage/plasmid-associated DNA primase